MNRIERAIPVHKKGIKKNFTAARKFASVDDAVLCYNNALSRLLNINHWDAISTADKGMFQVMSTALKPLRRKLKLEDYVRVGIPGPDNADGAGFDWVQVTQLIFSTGKRKEQCLLTLMPCPMPGRDATAHFFANSSSSSFVITRDNRTVSAEYFGHNEVPNTDTTGVKETIRNVVVAAGAIMGMSETMWGPLTKGLLMDGAAIREKKTKAIS